LNSLIAASIAAFSPGRLQRSPGTSLVRNAPSPWRFFAICYTCAFHAARNAAFASARLLASPPLGPGGGAHNLIVHR
jgi:hypothetical protein